MVAAAQAIQVAPRDQQEIEQASRLYRSLLQEGTAALVGPDGSRIDLPSSVHKVLVRVVEKMQEGKAIAVMPALTRVSSVFVVFRKKRKNPFKSRIGSTKSSTNFFGAMQCSLPYKASACHRTLRAASSTCSFFKLASSPEYRLCGRSLRTAIPSAFF